MGRLISLAALTLFGASSAPPKPSFKVQLLHTPSDVRRVDAADLDGDGKRDLIATLVDGSGPYARRTLAVFWNLGGRFNAEPDLVLPVEPSLCAFDLATLHADVGDSASAASLLALTPSGLQARRFTGRKPGPWTNLVSRPTVCARPPSDSLVRLKLAVSLTPGATALLVPGLGTVGVYRHSTGGFTPSEELAAESPGRIAVPKEARTPGSEGFTFSVEVPGVRALDVNGDGRTDLALVTDDRLAVFLQGADGKLASSPGLSRDFAVRTPAELQDRSATIRLMLQDVDGDGRADVVIAKQQSAGLTHASTTVYLFRAADGGYRLKPDQVLRSDGASFAGAQLVDVTGDRHPDLVLPSFHLGIFAVVRMLTRKKLDVTFQLFAQTPSKRFSPKPTATRDLTFGLALDGRSDTQAVDVTGDYDGDGRADLAFGTPDGHLAIYLAGKPDALFDDDAAAEIPLSGAGALLAVDLDGHHRSDLVVCYPATHGRRRAIAVAHNVAFTP